MRWLKAFLKANLTGFTRVCTYVSNFRNQCLTAYLFKQGYRFKNRNHDQI